MSVLTGSLCVLKGHRQAVSGKMGYMVHMYEPAMNVLPGIRR